LRFLKGGTVRRRRVEGHKLLPEAIREGDPKGRAVAARLPVTKTEFPAILQIARLWELEEDAGPAFVGDTRIEVESGPGPVQPFVRTKWFSCAGIKVKPCRESTLHTHLVFGVGLNLP